MSRLAMVLSITALPACADVLDIPEVHRAACSRDADFVAVGPVGGLSAYAVQSGQLSRDELTLVFSRKPAGLPGDLYITHRDRLDEDFRDARPLDEINTPFDELSGSISDDLLTLYFDREDHPDQNVYTTYVTSRATVEMPFGAPTQLLLGGDPSLSNYEPFLSPSGLYFGSRIPGSFPKLFTAPGSGTQFVSREHLTSLETQGQYTAYENPVVSADGLTIYFAAPSPTSAKKDIWIAHRASVRDPFDPPRLVEALNTQAIENPTWVSGDDCHLYFRTDRSGADELWLASRRQ